MRTKMTLHVMLLFALIFGTVGTSHAITLAGKVLLEDQSPVEGATVWFSQDRRVKKITTDASGSFSFSEASIFPVEVVAYKKGFALAGRTGLPTNDLTFDLVLGKETGEIKVRVTDKNFKPVPGSHVKSMVVSDQFSVPVEDLMQEGFPKLRANDAGEITVPAVPAGGFVKLVMAHHKYADSSIAYLPVRKKSQDIQLYDGVSVRGRVMAQEKPLAAARVSIFQTGVSGQMKVAEGQTDPEGFYSARVAPGGYMITARHPDYASPAPANVDASGDKDVFIDLAMPETRILEGQILMPGDKPSPGTRVAYQLGGVLYEDTLTDAEGNFKMRVGYPDGVLFIVAPPGYRTDSLPQIPVKMGEANHAKLTPIRLKELPVIKGRVSLPAGEEDIKRVLITALDAPQPLRFFTDDEGRFEIHLAYQPDKNEIKFRAEHPLRFLRRDFTINLDKEGNIAVALGKFEPDLKKRSPVQGRNNLSGFLDKPAPAIQCSDWFNTQAVDLEKLKGKVVVLTMWGGFDNTPFSANRLGELWTLYDLYQGLADDVVILGVHDASSETSEISDYLHRYDIRFPVGRDEDPFKTFVAYGVTFIPQTVLIDKKGVLRFDQVEGRLLELIKTLRRE